MITMAADEENLRDFLKAVAEGCTTYEDIGGTIGLSVSKTAQAARSLHKMSYTDDGNLGLIDITFDLANPRLKRISLNRDGFVFSKTLPKDDL